MYYGGSPLERSAGEKISEKGFIQPFVGSTEHYAWGHALSEREDWADYRFHPWSGACFE